MKRPFAMILATLLAAALFGGLVYAVLVAAHLHLEHVGTKRGRFVWPRRADVTVRPVWRFRNPSRYVLVRVSVDTSGPQNAELRGTAGEDM